MLEQWNAFKFFFTEEALDRGADEVSAINTILMSLGELKLWLYYMFLDWVLPKFSGINELFQSERSFITLVHFEMCQFYKELLLIFLDPRYVARTGLVKIEPSNSTHFQRLEHMYCGAKFTAEVDNPVHAPFVRNSDVLSDVKRNCRNFLVKGCEELRIRFDFSSESTFAKLYTLSPALAVSASSASRAASIVPIIRSVPRILSMENNFDLVQKIDHQW